jgi:hypothetical protein
MSSTRQKLLGFIVCLTVTVPLLAAIPSGYVSYWKMDGNLNDEAGINHGTIQGGDAVYNEGIWGRAVKLNSSALYVDLGTNASLNFTGSFSIGGWIYLTGGAGYQKCIDKSTWNSGFYVQQAGSWPGHWRFGFVGQGSAMDATGITTYINQWAHVMAVYDSANGVRHLYVNGQPAGDTVSAGMLATTASLKFGKVNGLVDEMIYYHRVLSGTEVGELMAATRDTTPPVISGIRADTLPAYSAYVRFTTNMLATAAVEYSKDSVYATYHEHAIDTLHQVRINGLNNGRVFHYRVHAWNRQNYESVSPWCTLKVAAVPPLQKLGLARGPQTPAPPDLVWPAAVGAADVCLWADDKLAAATITIDDNQADNQDWWMGQGDTLGLRFTWFVITGSVASSGTGNGGTWARFRTLFARGHGVQSHTETHGSSTAHTNGTINWAEDYGRARAILEDSIPGNQCLTVAYPGGGFASNSDTAAIFHASGRGTTAYPQNATGISYREVRASSSPETTHVKSILDKTTTIYGNNYRRGWACFLFHYLNADNTPVAHAFLRFLDARHDSLWVASYPDLIKYAQERDTYTLTVNAVTSSLISFTVTDSMMDTLFNYPLTVKVRIDNSWDSCYARQNGNPVEVIMVTNAGNKYALVKAVPDRGEVQLADAATTEIKPISTVRPDICPAGRKVTVYTMDGQRVSSGVIGAQGLILNEVTGNMQTGIYLVRVEGQAGVEKMLIVR